LLAGALSPTHETVPDLNWVQRSLPGAKAVQLAGRGSVDLQGDRDQHGAMQGSTQVQVSDLGLRTSDLHLGGNARLDAQFRTDATQADTLTFDRIRLGLTESTFGSAKRSSKAVSGSLVSNNLSVRSKAPHRAEGTVEVRASSASALLPLVVDSPFLREMQHRLLGLEDLKARTAFRVTDKHARFDLVQARSGDVTARGYVQRSERGPAGAFLVSTPLANVGLRVVSGEVQVQLFVSDRWLVNEPRGTTNNR
jgi:hypothetical protein